MMARPVLFALALLAGLVPGAGRAQDAADPLRIIMVDVEGGAAALYITPEGHSLLIDTGWPAGMGGPRAEPDQPAPPPRDSAPRIAAAARAAGLQRIDYLVVTHYHVDHVGGVAELLSLIPVGTIIDHGPNREEPVRNSLPAFQRFAPSVLYPPYLEAIAGHEHRVMQAGDTLAIDGLRLTAVNSDRAVIETALDGPAEGVGCAAVEASAEEGGEENPRSLGLLLEWGAARLLAMGDTTWDVENQVVCPANRVGVVDLYVANNHGSAISNSPVFVNNIAPRVVLLQNGPRKGADAEVIDTMRALPSLQALWQVHEAERAPGSNAPPARIANLAGGTDGHPLHVYVAPDAAITLVNPRTGHSETYKAPPR